MPEPTRDKLPRRERLPVIEAGDTEPNNEQEQRPERVSSETDAADAHARPSASPSKAPKPRIPAEPAPKNADLTAIEGILSEGLDDFFRGLSPQKQSEFKASGEATAVKIQTIVQRGSFKIREVLDLIVRWLKTLPGINKFFLEQEAKIKTDKILHRYRK